ncbi:MAG TPA: Gfo/Idh/MocA family oxidoreductase [Micrococcaceae bacterium]|jgi:scyllo-inositol 2-dehydrogenase (NADP+)|nr:Gfo/Idh/MocA family oxidoreductase [Micrococcaceae bacterium]
MQPIRTAVVGFGLAGSVFHAPAIAANPRYSLDVIVTSDPARQAQARAHYPEARIVDRPDQLLGNTAGAPGGHQGDALARLDLAVLATPPETHAALAHAALDARLAVVVDKPFTVTSEEGQKLADRARELGLVLSCYQNRRWDGEFLTLKKLLAQGALGQVHRFESRLERWSPDTVKPWKARATAEAGGGVLYDLGTHLIDQALQLFGAVDAVYGELDARRPQEKADDDAFVALHHRSGVRSHLWMNLSAAQLGPRYRVLGSKAAYTKQIGDGQEAQIAAGVLPGDQAYGMDPEEHWGRLGRHRATVPVPTERGDFPAFYELLAGAIRDGGPVPVDAADAVEALKIIEAVRVFARH